MNKDKLLSVLKYGLKNIQHPELRGKTPPPLFNYTIHDGYQGVLNFSTAPSTSKQVREKAQRDLKEAELKAQEVEDYESFLNNSKYLINELDRIERIIKEMKEAGEQTTKSVKAISTSLSFLEASKAAKEFNEIGLSINSL